MKIQNFPVQSHSLKLELTYLELKAKPSALCLHRIWETSWKGKFAPLFKLVYGDSGQAISAEMDTHLFVTSFFLSAFRNKCSLI